ncbi:polysaccharide deacetylase family sporulation protein PdaB [Paenibacillus apiarius]|uniref:Polysaccharide deacetylase family sporulation protein PdaB n=1 Tax=Paenibacillus apiarius TaxID=46240 RepID=A0ABT4DWL0_9BACL|nr:polysaccharide deacetylase family sporulation protein PdaB [Paenibacillus apiarius]MBN3523707.1 polysaccharide deacetylase family sporulation protein PdaB [Paenibacillus apiarius]MCY9516309.1 polysaccharide deacetylase family sporulation protein PdaB [Paenibacillus apiarius]MCY9520638.1 polysaccharide deacetylase family sporulation protein PdaB [Paenibacillus apiarius]MCY9552493.1 polysaccharide deacetylase family sporulation protein PdaB [Paenibacillus apiarius]MCY9561033.1 polysaccharide 
MNYFYVVSGKKMKRVFFLVVAALFAAGVVYVESDNITVFSEGSPSAIYSVPTDKKLIALTFDISWGDKRTEPIIKILEEKGVKKATFFLSSPWSKTHPDMVKKIVDTGFEVGSHGHKHVNYSSLSDEEIRRQISTAHQILADVTGKAPKLIRMPNGDFDKRVLRIADSLNYKVIQWDTDSLDWKNPGVDTIVNRVVKKAHPGDIVLLHASDSCKQTHLALPAIIDQLRAQGYEFVTVSELIQQTELKSKTIQDQSTMNQHLHNAAGM